LIRCRTRRSSARVRHRQFWECIRNIERGRVSAKAVTEWVAYYDKHGDVQPAGKLEGHEDYIRSAIKADPSISVHAFWQAFKKDRVEVGYKIMSKFIADLGYERDGAGRLVRRD
jgi:hypothetical protein